VSGRNRTTARAATRAASERHIARRASYAIYHDSQTARKVKSQSPTSTQELADLRARFEAAVLNECWADAARLQAAYHVAERRRRRELLHQAEVGRG